jgi:hypothetical protein
MSSIRSLFYSDAKTVASSATPEALTATPLLVQRVYLYALAENTDDVLLGFDSENSGTVEYFTTLPFTLEATPGRAIDLSKIYVQVAVDGEGVGYVGLN